MAFTCCARALVIQEESQGSIMVTEEEMRQDILQPLNCYAEPEGVKTHSMTKMVMKRRSESRNLEEVQMQQEAQHEIDMDECAWGAGGAPAGAPVGGHGMNPIAVSWRNNSLSGELGIRAGEQVNK